MVFREGEGARGWYMILAGMVKVFKRKGSGRGEKEAKKVRRVMIGDGEERA